MFDKNSRVIGKSGTRYLVTNDPKTTMNDILDTVTIVDQEGRHCGLSVCIGSLLNHMTDCWEPVDGEYEDYITVKNENLALTSLLGFAVGDAFGVPVEFKHRVYIKTMDLQDMIGNGTHGVPAGAWSDDTSMLISSMDSIARNNGEIIDRDIMDSFMEWLMGHKYLSVDFTFGVGGVIEKALHRYVRGFPISKCGCTGYFENGNGSLMRILPFSLYCIYLNLDQEVTRKIIDRASAYTHAHDISKMGCFMYTEFLRNLTVTRNPKLALQAIQQIDYSVWYSERAVKAFERLLSPDFILTDEDELKESGYVVDTLESVIYSLINSKDYESAVKTAVNLGYDTDTVAGITGSLAAVIYGMDSIPERWLEVLLKEDYLTSIAKKFNTVMLGRREANNDES